MDGATRTPEILRIAPGSTHDLTLMTVGPCCRGTLSLFDLAFCQVRREADQSVVRCRTLADGRELTVVSDVRSSYRPKGCSTWRHYRAVGHTRQRMWDGCRILLLVLGTGIACSRVNHAASPAARAPYEPIAQHYDDGNSWCLLLYRTGDEWMENEENAKDRYFEVARFDPPRRLSVWSECSEVDPPVLTSVDLGSTDTLSPATGLKVKMLSFLSRALLSRQDLSLLPDGWYAHGGTSVLSGRLATGEAVTYVTGGSGQVRRVFVATRQYRVDMERRVRRDEACDFDRCPLTQLNHTPRQDNAR
jgi:hypothetical protein